VIGEQRMVRAFLRGEAIARGPLEVELRESPPTTDPRSGRALPVPPLSILWVEERPLAVRLRNVVAISSFPSQPRLATLIETEAIGGGLAVEQLTEAALWRMFSRPPRPRLARRS
jgi:hypothetical protein